MKYAYDEFNNHEFESHRLTLNLIKEGTKILDLGCATGYIARELSKKGCETWGVDVDKEAALKARQYCKKVIVSDLDTCSSLAFPKKFFDYVILLDVIEHLKYPENILSIAKTHLKRGGKVLISTPNIAHASIRLMLMRGDFDYSPSGIMDNTHVHFYTMKSLGTFLKKIGLKVLKVIPTNGMCKVPLLYKITDRLPYSWQYKITSLAPTLFSHQFIAVAVPVERKKKNPVG